MKIIFHIGMGKTGTSSLQRALATNAEALERQKVHYLGMWFGLVAPKYHGPQGLAALFRNSPEDQQTLAQRFFDACAEQAGIETFILSSEGIFGHAHNAEPFFRALAELVDLSFVLYVRDPQSWLPSAFTQWGIRHKEQPGPVQPFELRARVLIRQYGAVRIWQENFGDRMQVRRHSPNIDVVQDFAEAVGIGLPALDQRYLERGEEAEILMRALFNDRFADPVMPDWFNTTVLNTQRHPVADIGEMIRRCFEMDSLAEIIAEHSATFDYIRDTFGFDFAAEDAPPPGRVDAAAVRARLLDHLAETVFQQGLRICRLEKELANLTAQSES